MAEPQVTTSPEVAMFGVKVAFLVAGFAGGVVSLSFVRDLTKVQSAIAVFTGAAVAAYGTPVFSHLMSVTPSMENGVAFVAGLTAMNIVPGVIKMSEVFRNNPWKFTGRSSDEDSTK